MPDSIAIPHKPLLSTKSTTKQTRRKVYDIVPIEHFQPMYELNGSNGTNRGDRNRTGVHNDYDAIHLWLSTVQPGSNTWRSYRKEAERFLLWSLLERGKPISSLTVADCIAYRDFLNDLGRLPDKMWNLNYKLQQANWLGKRATPRWSENWRPFETPPTARATKKSLLAGTDHEIIYLKPVLSPSSQKLAQTILKTMCEWLTRQRYLDSNPWDGVPALLKQATRIQVDRSFTQYEWEYMMQYLESKPYDARYARIRFIMKLGYGTGMRLSEMTGALVSDLKHRESSGTGVRGWLLNVIGKGNKERSVVVPTVAMEELKRYLAFRGYTSMQDVPEDAPLIDRMIGAPSPTLPGPNGEVIEVMANLSHKRVYDILKSFFEEVSNATMKDSPETAAKIRKGSTHWLRHTSGSHAVAKGIPIEIVQANFGHASVDTTSIYITAETDRRIQEMEKLM